MAQELLTMRGFEFYTPEYNAYDPNTPHLCDDQGRDWYYWRYKFRSDTLKIVFDEDANGQIVSADPSAEFMLPMGGPAYVITEVPLDAVPGGFEIDEDQSWFYKDGKIQQTDTGRALKMKRLRTLVLGATDFMVVADYPLSKEDRAALQSVRQALRDLPSAQDFPHVPFVALPDFMLKAARDKGMTMSEYNYLRSE